jgi:hypothetical protein
MTPNIVVNTPVSRSLRRSRQDEKKNIKMDLMDTGLKSVNWINLAPNKNRWRAVVNTTIQVP